MTDINGFTVENTKVGAFRVNDPDASLTVEGPLVVESLQLDSLTIGDPPYSLPEAKGSAGDIIVATTDGSTSEWQPAFQGTARVWQNIYSMYEPRGFSSKTQWEAIDQFGYGNRSSIDPSVFPIGSSFKFTIKSQCEYTIFVNGDSAIIQLRLEIQGNFPAIFLDLWQWNVTLNTNVTLGTLQTGALDTTFYVTRTSSTNLRINSLSINDIDNGISTTTTGPVVKSLQNISLGSFPIDVPFSDTGNLQLTVASKDLSGPSVGTTARLVPVLYTIDLCSNSTSILATSENLTTDHLLLSNINAIGPSTFPDGGHSLMYLSDGSKPMGGNINMSSNNIVNCASVQNDGGTEILDFSGGDALLKTNGTLAGLQETNTLNNVAASATTTGVTALAGDAIIRSLGTGRILATSTGGGDIEIETKTVLADVKIASNQNMELNAKVDLTATALNTMTLNAPTILSTGILSMGNNAIINCSSVQDQDRIDIISNVSDVLIQCGQLVPPTPPIIVADFRYDRTEINNNLNVPSINNLTPVGGLSAGTSNGALLTASTTEQSILSATFVGGRQAPPNSFRVGDSYTAVLAGNFSSNNGDTLTLRLKGGATATTVLSTLVVPLNGSSGVYFELEIDFVIRAIGAAGVADVVSNYDFSYNQASGGNFQGERKCEINNSTFDTTILNQLDITAQFSSTNAGNSIQTLLSTLGKTY